MTAPKLPLLGAVAIASAAFFGFGSASAETAPSCGAPGKPACPLQAWMRTHAAAPLATQDFAALERAMAEISELNPSPDKWANWTKIARDGQAAAKEKRLSGVKETCGRCHRAYRRAYNARHRTRPITD